MSRHAKKTLTLVQLLSTSRDELEADFQQFYGLDIGDMGHGYSVAHAAVLASQLPRQARCLRKLNPDFIWSDETTVLTSLHFLLRCVIYQLSGCRGEKPAPIRTPRERMRLAESLAAAESAMDEVAEFLGIKVGE